MDDAPVAVMLAMVKQAPASSVTEHEPFASTNGGEKNSAGKCLINGCSGRKLPAKATESIP